MAWSKCCSLRPEPAAGISDTLLYKTAQVIGKAGDSSLGWTLAGAEHVVAGCVGLQVDQRKIK